MAPPSKVAAEDNPFCYRRWPPPPKCAPPPAAGPDHPDEAGGLNVRVGAACMAGGVYAW
jgi:hypothetical protein